MKKLLFLLIFAFSIGLKANSQDSTYKKANAIYVEGLGLGILGSINYDKVITKTGKWQISLRTGIDPVIIQNIPLIVELNFFEGFGKNHLELGMGGLNALVDKSIIGNINNETTKGLFLALAPHIGYRYQASKPNGHTFFKVFTIPMAYFPYGTIGENKFEFIFWGGIAYGISF